MKRCVSVDKNLCVSCGVCKKVCPKKAIDIFKGVYAKCNEELCVGCGICVKNCPAGALEVIEKAI